MFKKYFIKKKFKKIIESIRIAEQILGDPHGRSYYLGIPVSYVFTIDVSKNNYIFYKDFNLTNFLNDYEKLKKDCSYSFKYHNFSYTVKINKDIKCIELIIWIDPQEI